MWIDQVTGVIAGLIDNTMSDQRRTTGAERRQQEVENLTDNVQHSIQSKGDEVREAVISITYHMSAILLEPPPDLFFPANFQGSKTL